MQLVDDGLVCENPLLSSSDAEFGGCRFPQVYLVEFKIWLSYVVRELCHRDARAVIVYGCWVIDNRGVDPHGRIEKKAKNFHRDPPLHHKVLYSSSAVLVVIIG